MLILLVVADGASRLKLIFARHEISIVWFRLDGMFAYRRDAVKNDRDQANF
jgi:hypothetical protein